jgi:hypothetical protein
MKSVALIASICLCSVLNAQNGNFTARWRTNDKVEKSDFHQIKKSSLFCALSNDNDFIIINLMIPDTKLSEMILKDGMTIWINMDNKQIRKLGVRFPLGSENGSREIDQDAERNYTAADLISQANTIEIIGFISEQERHFAAQNNDNFRGYVKFSPDGELYYRLVLPVSKLPLRNSKDGTGATPFALGFEIGYHPGAVKKGQTDNVPKKGSALYWINGVRLASSK